MELGPHHLAHGIHEQLALKSSAILVHQCQGLRYLGIHIPHGGYLQEGLHVATLGSRNAVLIKAVTLPPYLTCALLTNSALDPYAQLQKASTAEDGCTVR